MGPPVRRPTFTTAGSEEAAMFAIAAAAPSATFVRFAATLNLWLHCNTFAMCAHASVTKHAVNYEFKTRQTRTRVVAIWSYT